MQKYISLLRGINVSGQKKIKMDALRDLYASLGFTNVKSYIQSGNVIFESDESNVSSLVQRIESKIEQVYGFSVPITLRTSAQMLFVLENNPFLGERQEEIKQLYVTFFLKSPDKTRLNDLTQYATKAEEFHLNGQEMYLFYPNGTGRSKLSNNLIERKLGISATTRNWRTVNKLVELSI